MLKPKPATKRVWTRVEDGVYERRGPGGRCNMLVELRPGLAKRLDRYVEKALRRPFRHAGGSL